MVTGANVARSIFSMGVGKKLGSAILTFKPPTVVIEDHWFQTLPETAVESKQ